ncbi:phosphoglycerate mutase-like protein [Hypomontagnella monticulosa]|nr:phosphoglycerate mutase-like protein [Hypomontagnella monticulosa]
MSAFSYKVVAGFFEHDSEPEGPEFRAKTLPSLGLISQTYETDRVFDPQYQKTQWERFIHFVDYLNKADQGKAVYKLVYVIRHGEGFHNVKEKQVGRHQWEDKWARLDGDGEMSWADAKLTDTGVEQAKALDIFWQGRIESIAPPQQHYTSPLTRCLQTTSYAYKSFTAWTGQPLRPIIREGLRERMGVHTCDRRSTRTWIKSKYPTFHVGREVTETDQLWKPDQRETMRQVEGRVQQVLDGIFSNDNSTVISITAHSGLIRALYTVIGHREVWVQAGAMVPILIRARKV